MIEQLENEAMSLLAANVDSKARVRVSAAHAGNEIDVTARGKRGGGVIYGYSYGGVRVDRSNLLLLTCPESACDLSQSVQRKWRDAHGAAQPTSERKSSQRLKVASLFDENPVVVGSRNCVARPASFECVTPCPVGAHAPIRMHKTGWDLFENGRCIAGGLVRQSETSMLAPLLPTLESAKSWLNASHSAASINPVN